MFKNVASQKIALFAFDTTTSAPKTGDQVQISAYVSKDWGAVTQLGDTSASQLDATNAPGWYVFDLTQAETAADALLFSGKSTTPNVSIVGALVFTRPPNFSSVAIDSTGNVKVQSNIKKNVARPYIKFVMTDTTNHNPLPGLGASVAVTRSIDAGSHAAGTLSTVTELANGEYRFDAAAGDMNGDVITFRMTATGADALEVTFYTVP